MDDETQHLPRQRYPSWDGSIQPGEPHLYHSHPSRFPLADRYAQRAVWPPMEGPSPKAYGVPPRGRVRRSWNVGWRRWAKYPLWALGLGIVLAVILCAVGSIGAACVAHCPVP